jgi:FixJ family two-component response regulator
MNADDRMIYVVDDDQRIREALSDLLLSLGFNSVTFSSATEYIEFSKPDVTACLILDVDLPDINGLELQGQLAGKPHPPIIFLTGKGDIPSSVRAIKGGAVDFLPKPFSRDGLVLAVQEAFAQDAKSCQQGAELAELRRRFFSADASRAGGIRAGNWRPA